VFFVDFMLVLYHREEYAEGRFLDVGQSGRQHALARATNSADTKPCMSRSTSRGPLGA